MFDRIFKFEKLERFSITEEQSMDCSARDAKGLALFASPPLLAGKKATAKRSLEQPV